MVVAKQAQKIRAAALAPTQVAGVINQAREIRVLEVDPNRQHMPAPAGVRNEFAGKIGPAASSIRLRHRPAQSPAAPPSAPAEWNSQARPRPRDDDLPRRYARRRSDCQSARVPSANSQTRAPGHRACARTG